MGEKRRTNYYADSQKKYAQANKDQRYRNQHKSVAKRFIRDEATLEELNELQELIENRRKNTLDAIDFTDRETVIAIAKYCHTSDVYIRTHIGKPGFDITVYEPSEWVEQMKGIAEADWDADDLENWFDKIGAKDWVDLLTQLEAGTMGVIENGIENGIYEGKPFILETPL